MDLTSTFAPITKTEEQSDGSLLVYGKATDDSLDLDDQRCDATWLNQAMPDWFRYGNIREQHRADSAIGKAIEHEAADDGHYITAKIVDPVAVLKTKAGVFTGFSIGIRKPRIVHSDRAPKGLIKGGTITEVSLVDRPANSNAILTLCKAAKTGWEGSGSDLDQERGLVRCEELLIDEEGLAKALQVTITKGVEDDLAQGTASGCDGGDPRDEMTVLEKAFDGLKTFDREKALELVKSALAKADSPATENLGVTVPPVEPPAELPDIMGAKGAIAIIAQLIISEASDMVCAPNEDIDIQCLMQAVAALRQFICREHGETDNSNYEVTPMYLAVGSDAIPIAITDRGELVKAKYSADELRSMLGRGQAFRNANGEPSYPIADKEDLSNAIRAVGRGSGSHDAIRAYIIRRAKSLGASDMIPDNWSSSGSNKAADSDVVVEKGKTVTVTQETETSNAEDVKVSDEAVKKSVDEAPSETESASEAAADQSDEAVDKASEPDTTKAAGAATSDDLIKAFTGALEKEDSPLRKMFASIVEASNESTVKSLGELGERLATVERMAAPGGPSLRRTEVERVNARKSDLIAQSARFKALAAASEDPDLRKGYTQKALQLDAELKVL